MRRSSRRRPWWARTWDQSGPGVQFAVLAFSLFGGLAIAVVVYVLFPLH